jgi:hypothetical protein
MNRDRRSSLGIPPKKKTIERSNSQCSDTDLLIKYIEKLNIVIEENKRLENMILEKDELIKKFKNVQKKSKNTFCKNCEKFMIEIEDILKTKNKTKFFSLKIENINFEFNRKIEINGTEYIRKYEKFAVMSTESITFNINQKIKIEKYISNEFDINREKSTISSEIKIENSKLSGVITSMPRAPPLPNNNSMLPRAPPLPNNNSCLPRAPPLPNNKSSLPRAPPLPNNNSSLPRVPPLPNNNSSLPRAPPLPNNNSSLPRAPPLPNNKSSLPRAPPLPNNNSSLPRAPPLPNNNSSLPRAPPLPNNKQQEEINNEIHSQPKAPRLPRPPSLPHNSSNNNLPKVPSLPGKPLPRAPAPRLPSLPGKPSFTDGLHQSLSNQPSPPILPFKNKLELLRRKISIKTIPNSLLKKTIWPSMLLEFKIPDYLSGELFDQHFSKEIKKAIESTISRKDSFIVETKTSISLFDEKRSRNLSIILSRFNISSKELYQILDNFDLNALQVNNN